MALSGSFYGTTANAYIKPKIQWSATQSAAGNYSDITATLSYSRTNTGYTTGGTWSGSLTIGASKATGTKALSITYNSNTVAITHKARVYHDAEGKLSVKITAAGAISGSSLSSTAISATVTLDTIPRASTLSATNANIGSRATVVIDRKGSGFTHSVAYSFEGLKGYLKSDGSVSTTEVKFSATTVNFLVPERFYTKIPNAKKGTCTLTCKTYSGTTQIGSAQTAKFTATADKSLCAPTVSGKVVDINEKTIALTGSENTIVRGLSVARCTLTAKAKNSATIASAKIAGKSLGSFSTASASGTVDLENLTGAKVVFQATDSRGYATGYTCDTAFVSYVLLTNNASVRRTDPTSGNATLQLKGSCWKGNFGAADNALTATYQVGMGETVSVEVPIQDNHTYALTIPLSDLDYTQSHDLTVTLQDKGMTVTKKLTVQKGVPVFDWGEQDFRFHVPVIFPAGQTTLQTGDFAGDANDVTYNAVLRTRPGITNGPEGSGYLLSFAVTDKYILQFCCDYNGGNRKTRTYWNTKWYDWKEITE